MTTSIDQKEYLKKYLSSVKALKKRNKVKKKLTKVKIIDDDLDLATFNEAVTEDLTGGEVEDAPQIVGIMDERPPELRVNDYKTDMWKSVTVLDSDEESDTVKALRKASDQRDFSPPRVKTEPTDSDNSPPRRRDIDHSLSKQRTKNNCDADDNSPPRKFSNKNSIQINASRREDFRKSEYQNSPRTSPDRNTANIRRRGDARRNDDYSPPRKPNQENSSKSSAKISTEKNLKQDTKILAKRRSRWNDEDQNSDNSPQRKSTNRSDNDNSPPRRSGNKDNYSPPRRKTLRQDEDISPPRKDMHKRRNSDNSPPRRKNDDNSPPRRKNDDNSPPRKNRSDRNETHQKKRKNEHYDNYKSSDNLNRANKNIPSTSKNINDRFDEKDSFRNNFNNPSTSKVSDERKRNNSEDQLAETSSVRSTIRGSHDVNLNLVKKEASEDDNNIPTTIVRDRKTGRIRNLREEAAAKMEKNKEKEAIKEKYSRWGKGLKQVDDANEKRAQDLHEMQKPLARYADDVDLEDMLKNREREGDPMLDYLRKKKREKTKNDPNAKPEKPAYQGDSGPPNRFGIKPGYRWDGVDRSNGFEKKYFEVQNSRRAHQAESYKWSSEDM